MELPEVVKGKIIAARLRLTTSVFVKRLYCVTVFKNTRLVPFTNPVKSMCWLLKEKGDIWCTAPNAVSFGTRWCCRFFVTTE